MDVNNRTELAASHWNTLKNIQEARSHYVAQKNLLEQHDYDMKQVEDKHKLAISQELDDKGLNKFKNAEARSSELSSRVRKNENYQVLKNSFDDGTNQLREKYAYIENLKDALKFFEAWGG
jgi:hypothetical protein